MFNDPASVLMGLRMLRRGGGPVFLLRDEFTTDASAPLTSPRTCEPGPGTLTIVDAGNNLSISGGKLLRSGTTAYGLSSGSVARSAGLCALADYTSSDIQSSGFGFDRYYWVVNNNSSYPVGPGNSLATVLGAYSTGLLAIILQTTGAFYLRNRGTWVLDWVNNSGTENPVIMSYSAQNYLSSFKSSYVRLFNLGSPWSTDYGIATNRVASASAGETTTSEADALVEATWTAATGETWELDVRKTDDNNRWCVRCSQSGSTIKLIQIQAGVETERSSASQTWTNGSSYRLVVIADTQTIKTYVANTAKNSYTSASFNQTATGVKTSHAVSNLIAWPRTLSGAALAELQRYTA